MFTPLKDHLELTLVELAAASAPLAQALVAELRKRDVKFDAKAPIGLIPMVRQLIEESRLADVVKLAQVSTSAADALKTLLSPEAIDNGALQALVSKSLITAAEASALGKVLERYYLCDDDADLVKVVNKLAGENLNSELAAWAPARWTAGLRSVGATVPPGTTIDDVSIALSRRFEVLFPTSALVGRLPPPTDAVHEALEALVGLEKRNPRRFDRPFDELDLEEVPPDSHKEVEARWQVLMRMVRAYRGLGLDEVLDTYTLSTKERFAELQQRIEALTKALLTAAGSGLRADVLTLDLSRESKDWQRFQLSTFVDPIKATIRTFQRMRAVAGGIDGAMTLLAAGFSSATEIARQRLSEIQALPGLSGRRGEQIWETARTLAADAALYASGIIDEVGAANGPAPTLPPPSVTQSFSSLDGYASLFGNQSYCDCAHCASVLGPAAYFVDLMDFVRREVGAQLPPGAPMTLRRRRPDLWTFPLTCSATTTPVPTLTIVNEVLENAVATAAQYSGSFADRVAVEDFVYQTSAGLPGHTASFDQPFALGLASVSAHLTAFAVARPVLADALGVETARTLLGVSLAVEQLITTPRTTLAAIGEVYGYTFGGTPAAVAEVDATVLGPAMGLDRDALGHVVNAWFTRQGGATPRIDPDRRDPSSVQNDIEWVRGLTVDALDRMHRLVRLARTAGLDIGQTDRLLRALGDRSLLSLEPWALRQRLATRFGAALTDHDAAVLAGPLDAEAAGPFNRGVRDPAAAWPNAATRFLHPALVPSVAAADRGASVRLASGLALTDAAVLALVRNLAPHLAQESTPGFDPDAPDPAARYFVLSTANLTLLLRHARLAALLELSIDELVTIMRLAGVASVTGLADARAVVDAVDAWRASGRTLDALMAATGGAPTNAGTLLSVATVAASIRRRFALSRAVPDHLFAAAYGLSAADAAAILSANASLFATVGGVRVMADDAALTPAAVTVPPGIRVTVDGTERALAAADLVAALLPHTAEGQVQSGLATSLGRDEAEVIQLLGLAAIASGAALARSVVDAANGTHLEVAIAAVSRVDVATRGWSAAGLALLKDAPTTFGPGAWPTIDPARPDVPRFTFAQATALGRAAGRGSATDRQDPLLAVASQFDPATAEFAPAADPTLALLLGTTAAKMAGLRGRVALPNGVIAALDRLKAAVGIATRLGVDGDTLQGLVSDDDVTRATAAAALEQAASERGESDAAEKKLLDDGRALLRERRRDALVDHLLRARAIAPDRNALAGLLLVDIDAGGCATTSRVVAATNAVQEYITRITLGVETNGADPVSASFAAVTLSDDGQRSWEWRRAYRVWEANRRVFLWPENYLDPGVRDDKTPQFVELEEGLGQSPLDEASILSAYATYLQELEALAGLRLAGAYHDLGGGAPSDVLHLIGVTARDPATFYYRSVTNLQAALATPVKSAIWGHWQKLAISAPTRTVSPVVHQGRLSLLWPTVKTRALQSLGGGNMRFTGYRHTFNLVSVSLLPTGTWGQAQAMGLPFQEGGWFDRGEGVIEEGLNNGTPRYDTSGLRHGQPVDGYSLTGTSWARAVPIVHKQRLRVVLRNHRFVGDLDLYARVVADDRLVAAQTYPGAFLRLSGASGRDLTAIRPRFSHLHPEVLASAAATPASRHMYAQDVSASLLPQAFEGQPELRLARHSSPADVLPVLGRPESAIVHDGESFLVTPLGDDAGRFALRRTGSSVVSGLGRALFEEGIDGLLATARQLALAEATVPFSIEPVVLDRTDAGTLNFRGSMGTYLRELFLHIPLLIATALAARGRHADARRWFHRVFDPTSTERIDTTTTPASDRQQRRLDRVWRYRELRGLTIESARDILTDGEALHAYVQDPFNPHAIARRRLSAYKRYAFARYVDNLLDWGDLLFAQFTRESVEEARGLYQLAAQLLGTRPARLGDCSPHSSQPRSYGEIEPLLDQAESLRIGAENEVMARRAVATSSGASAIPWMAAIPRLTKARNEIAWRTASSLAPRPSAFDRRWLRGRVDVWGPSKSLSAVDGQHGLAGQVVDDTRGQVGAPARSPADHTLASSVLSILGPVFCLPVNRTLLARWDRVEDRLWKLHHCLDLDGVRRDLALFAPELDPMSRVAATALGLTPDDLVSDVAADVPPYRFAYLIERAKGFASSLAGFGSSLFGALERRDNEALSILRQEQGLAMARLTRQQRVLDLESAKESHAAVARQLQSAEYREAYYDGLLAEGKSTREWIEIASREAAMIARTLSAAAHLTATPLRAIPETCAPWAVCFGGEQLAGVHSSLGAWAGVVGALSDGAAGMAGLEGGFERRDDGWRHQRRLSRDEVASLRRQERAAALRVTAAEQALTAHDESIQQLEDILDFERERVTNLTLHTRMAQGLKALYRLAYGHALALARLAERAYRYERGDGVGGLASGYWDAHTGGLLAGERLLSDLQALDRRFLETHHRELEIDQSFPLSMLDPVALVALQESGTCAFEVPEVAFDQAYPGHYKRRLRAVRLSIPCVSGPYVNVSAMLELEASQVRPAASGDLVEVPRAHGTTIAASTAQADGGVFELSFRDERYLPFEGQGAVSRWKLTLPGTVRSFDYRTITEAVVSLAYTARYDAARRDAVEAPAGPASLLTFYREQPSQVLISGRRDWSHAFAQLVHAELGTAVPFELPTAVLPPVYQGRAMLVESAPERLLGLALRTAPDLDLAGVRLTFDGTPVSGFQPEPALGGLWFAPFPWPAGASWGEHSISFTAGGPLVSDGAIDPTMLDDVLLLLPVRLRGGQV